MGVRVRRRLHRLWGRHACSCGGGAKSAAPPLTCSGRAATAPSPSRTGASWRASHAARLQAGTHARRRRPGRFQPAAGMHTQEQPRRHQRSPGSSGSGHTRRWLLLTQHAQHHKGHQREHGHAQRRFAHHVQPPVVQVGQAQVERHQEQPAAARGRGGTGGQASSGRPQRGGGRRQALQARQGWVEHVQLAAQR